MTAAIRAVLPLMLMLLLTGKDQAVAIDQWVADAPIPLLRSEYHAYVKRPLEYVGFSFSGANDELRAMKARGANAVGVGEMWNPVRQPDAPFGLGIAPGMEGCILAQSFTAPDAFDAVAPCLPTRQSTDSGCSWRLVRLADDGEGRAEISQGTWEQVADNSWPLAEVGEQPPGRYELELFDATGTWIGWWAVSGDPQPGGRARASVTELEAGLDFELRLRTGGEMVELGRFARGQQAIALGPSEWDRLETLGMFANFSIGNWNNPGFTYYPEWFFQAYPETIQRDAEGLPVMGGGMFDREVPTPNIESAAIVNGTRRLMQDRVRRAKDKAALLYYVMGGEELYATYMYPDRWTDYSDNALTHFRAWLAVKRYANIEALNQAWGTTFPDFASVEAPREPAVTQKWLDWIDFRFATMGERIGWMYQALRETDPDRMAFTCNHGTVYHDSAYARMGTRYELFAAHSDGFETGQIMQDSDPEYYNLLYAESISGLGKPYSPVRLAYKKSDPEARGGGTSYTPQAVRRYGYESLGAGAWHLGFIQWSGSLPDGEWGVEGTPGEKAIGQFHAEIEAMAPVLEGMYAIQPRLAVFWSHPTWTLEGFQDSWHGLHKRAIQRQVPKSYVYDYQLIHGLLDTYPVLLSLDNRRVSRDAVEALARYAEQGGRLMLAGDNDAKLVARVQGHPNVEQLGRVPADAILDALGDRSRPVKLHGIGTTVRKIEQHVGPHSPNLPVDLAEHGRLGQTIVVESDGLNAVALRMPTYTTEPPVGFSFEVRRDGPAGQVLAQREVGKAIGDNTWVELQLASAPEKGATIYVGAVAHPDLPVERLGWWSSTWDSYPNGSAWINGEPVDGDRQVKCTYFAPTPTAESVEAFVLSDGLSSAVVLVNISETEAVCDIDLAALAFGGGPRRVTAQLRPKNWQGDGLMGRIAVAGNDAEVLHVEWTGGKEEALRLVSEARSTARVWRDLGAETDYVKHANAAISRAAAKEAWSKMAAAALNITRRLGMSVSAPPLLPEGRAIKVAAVFYDDAGDPVDVDRAWVELTPTENVLIPLEKAGDGRYIATLSTASLPKVYNYTTRTYEDYRGAMRLRFAARAGDRSVSALRDMVVVAPRDPAPEPK